MAGKKKGHNHAFQLSAFSVTTYLDFSPRRRG
jgi:hypothetical protein